MRAPRDLEDWLAERLATELGVPADGIDVDAPFAEFGLDSLQAVAISGELETLLGRRLSPTLLWDHPSIAKLATHLAGAGS